MYGFIANDGINNFDMLGLYPGPGAHLPGSNVAPVSPHVSNGDIGGSGCPQAFESLLSKKPHSDIVSTMAKKGCSVRLRCICEKDSAGDSITKWNNGSKIATITCTYPVDKPPQGIEWESTLLHELVHARDYCDGWLKDNDCRAQVCSELKAYTARDVLTNPALWSQGGIDAFKEGVILSAGGSAAQHCKGGKKEAIRIARKIFDECVGEGHVY